MQQKMRIFFPLICSILSSSLLWSVCQNFPDSNKSFQHLDQYPEVITGNNSPLLNWCKRSIDAFSGRLSIFDDDEDRFDATSYMGVNNKYPAGSSEVLGIATALRYDNCDSIKREDRVAGRMCSLIKKYIKTGSCHGYKKEDLQMRNPGIRYDVDYIMADNVNFSHKCIMIQKAFQSKDCTGILKKKDWNSDAVFSDFAVCVAIQDFFPLKILKENLAQEKPVKIKKSHPWFKIFKRFRFTASIESFERELNSLTDDEKLRFNQLIKIFPNTTLLLKKFSMIEENQKNSPELDPMGDKESITQEK